MRKTHALIQIAIALMADPDARHWGYDTSRRAGIRSGVMYPILQRMLEARWLADGWEDGDPAKMGRPPRRYYHLTSEGKQQLGELLESARTEARFRHLFSDKIPASPDAWPKTKAGPGGWPVPDQEAS